VFIFDAIGAESVTFDQYARSVVDLIRSNLHPVDRTVTAARLGLLLRQGGGDWALHGYRSLKDLLTELERRGFVRAEVTPKGALAVSVHDQGLPPTMPGPASAESIPPLRKTIWLAFIAEHQYGRRFLRKATGDVRVGDHGIPDASGQWIEIVPITSDQQKRWAEEFLRSKDFGQRAGFEAALASPDWYKELPRKLAVIDPEFAKEWNRLRSRRVAEYVLEFFRRNGIDPALATEPARPRPTALIDPARVTPVRGSNARARVLAALQKMPTSELLEISIPAKYLVGISDEVS
jgi:hypothetical protein